MKSLIIQNISGTALPLVGNDIDTDRIMPARYLKELTFENLGRYVFFDDILQDKQNNKLHPFSDPKYQSAKFLIANSNFGCGSSREHAPQGLKRWGIDCIFAESYSEIFFSNCYSIGLPCLTLSKEDIQSIQNIVSNKPLALIEIDLSKSSFIIEGESFTFKLEDGLRQAFTGGKWDQTASLLKNTDKISTLNQELPYTYS